MDMPAELIRLAMSPFASAKLSVGLKTTQPGKAASKQPQARYGRDEDLAEVLVITILQMCFVPAAFAGDVAA